MIKMKNMRREQLIKEICQVTSYSYDDLKFEDYGTLDDMYIIYCCNGDMNKRVNIIT
jgi:hypothetical protein